MVLNISTIPMDVHMKKKMDNEMEAGLWTMRWKLGLYRVWLEVGF